MRHCLIAVGDGANAGERYELNAGQTTIGRDDGNSIVVADSQVSRRHAAVRVTDGRVEIRDSGSTNGTFVNGLRVGSPKELRRGDRVRVGQALFEFVPADESDIAPTAADSRASSSVRATPATPLPTPASTSSPDPTSVGPVSGTATWSPIRDPIELTHPDLGFDARAEHDDDVYVDGSYARQVTMVAVAVVALVVMLVFVLVRSL